MTTENEFFLEYELPLYLNTTLNGSWYRTSAKYTSEQTAKQQQLASFTYSTLIYYLLVHGPHCTWFNDVKQRKQGGMVLFWDYMSKQFTAAAWLHDDPSGLLFVVIFFWTEVVKKTHWHMMEVSTSKTSLWMSKRKRIQLGSYIGHSFHLFI